MLGEAFAFIQYHFIYQTDNKKFIPDCCFLIYNQKTFTFQKYCS